MANGVTGTPLYKIAGFAGAGLVLVLAVVLIVVFQPRLQRDSPTERLRMTLAAQFPGAEPKVASVGTDTVQVSLKVVFDPTIDADQAQTIFTRAVAVAEAQTLKGVKTLEVVLLGISLEGGATSASRTFDYGGGTGAGGRG